MLKKYMVMLVGFFLLLSSCSAGGGGVSTLDGQTRFYWPITGVDRYQPVIYPGGIGPTPVNAGSVSK